MGTPSFGAPPPVEYNPPSILSRYRGLLILFVIIFIGAFVVGHYLIRAQRDQPLPPSPVYLQNLDGNKP